MALVTKVASDGVAKRAGVRVGDYAVAMNGRDVADYDEFVSLFPRCPRPVRVTVRRFEWVEVASRPPRVPEDEQRPRVPEDDPRRRQRPDPSGIAVPPALAAQDDDDDTGDVDDHGDEAPASQSASRLEEEEEGEEVEEEEDPHESGEEEEEEEEEDDDDDDAEEDEEASGRTESRREFATPSEDDSDAVRLVDFGTDASPLGFSIERDERDMARVSKVAPGGRAARLGIKVDDVVMSLNGRHTTAYDVVVATLPLLPRPLVVGVVRWTACAPPNGRATLAAAAVSERAPHRLLASAVANGLDPRKKRGALASKPPSPTVAAGGFGARGGGGVNGGKAAASPDNSTTTADRRRRAAWRDATFEQQRGASSLHTSSDRGAGASSLYRRSLGGGGGTTTTSGTSSAKKHALAAAAADDERAFDVVFADGPLGMRIEERLGLVPVTVVTHVDPAGQAYRAGVRVGCTIVGLNGDRYLSHAHAAATLRHGKRPVAARLRHAD